VYVPKHFEIKDVAWARAFMDEHRFATLVTIRGGEPFATHVPLVYEPEPEPYGTLRGHVARANPHWQSFDAMQLVMFTGPHAYVSPTWYRSGGPAVPTWNYTAVHAYGHAQIVEDPGEVRDLLVRLTDREEAGRTPRYTVDAQDPDYVQHMMRQIVAFRIPIERLEAKAKLSQNRTPEERERVAKALGGDLETLMRTLSPR
jgi:transcriptional regulator